MSYVLSYENLGDACSVVSLASVGLQQIITKLNS